MTPEQRDLERAIALSTRHKWDGDTIHPEPWTFPTNLRTVIMSVAQRGPDKTGRMWDHPYTEVEFLACIMECGTQRDFVNARPYEDYWYTVDTWFEHHYPERYDCQQQTGGERISGDVFSGQMGFKIALWNYLGEHDGAQKIATV